MEIDYQWDSASSTWVISQTYQYYYSTLNTGIETITNGKLRIYPNPVRDELRIENGEWRIEKVEILDLTGKIILNSQLSILHSVNVSALPQGIYIVKLKTDKGIVTEKFIKE